MRPSLRPRLLGHLREMLSEREEDITTLQARLHASEALQGGALARLEQLEALLGPASLSAASNGGIKEKASPLCFQQLSERLLLLERTAAERGLLTNGHTSSAAKFTASDVQHVEQIKADFGRRLAALERVAAQVFEAGEASRRQSDGSHEQLRASQQLVRELQEQLHVSNVGRSTLAGESDRWRREAESLRAEAASLRSSLARAEAEATSKQAPAPSFEVEAMRCRLKQSVQEASLLRSQLAAREADVTRLERRVRELEGPLGVSSKGGVSTTALSSSALLCGGSGGSGGSGSVAAFGSNGTLLTAAALSGILDEEPSARPDDFQDGFGAATASSSRTVSRRGSRNVSPDPGRRQVAVPLVTLESGTSRLGDEAAACSTPRKPGAALAGFAASLPAFGADALLSAGNGGYGQCNRQAMQPQPTQLPAVQPLPGLRAHPASSSSTTSPAPTSSSLGAGAAGPARARTPPPQQLIRVDVAGLGVQRARSPPRPGPPLNSAPSNGENGLVTRLISAPADPGTVTTPPLTPPPQTIPHPVSPTPADGAPHTLQRSQSLPVQLLRAGATGNQASASGVSLAQWAASPGGPSSGGGGTPAQQGSPQALGGPPGAQVLGNGLGQPPPMQMLATGPLGLAARRHS